MTSLRACKTARPLLAGLALALLCAPVVANTLNQNVSWTIDRSGTTAKYRVVAYGDSIYAGYNGSTTSAARYSAPTVDAEYLAALWNADVESVRRAKARARSCSNRWMTRCATAIRCTPSSRPVR